MLKKQFNLYDYQIAFKNNIRTACARHQRIIACSATGSGKSKTFISIAVDAINMGKTVLIISESTKIFQQISAEIYTVFINPENKNINTIQPRTLYLAMAQTLIRRPHLITQFADYKKNLLVIADEAHLGHHTKILLQLLESYIVGFTATPVAKHLPQIYNEIVIGPQPHELVINGYLASYKHFVRRRADLDQLQIGSNGEYTDQSQEAVFEKRQVYDGLIEDLHTIEYKKGLIFCASINDCRHTNNELTANGFKVIEVHTGLPKSQQAYNLYQFTHGLTPLCISVGMLGKGFDYQPTDLVALKLKTTSLANYLQFIGRASRILDYEAHLPYEQRTKKHFTVLDYGENIVHKPWDWDRDWQTIWREVKQKKPGVPPIKFCPMCDFVCNLAARICENCGYEFVNIGTQPEQPTTVLQEITYNYQQIVNKKIGSLTPEELAVYANEKNKKRFAIRVARARAQTDSDFLFAFAQAMNYKQSWVQRMLTDLPTEPIEYNNITLR